MVEEGRLGKKMNVGWYRYPGGNGKVEDPIVEDLVIEESWFAKVTRREFSEDEILERLLTIMINEACLLIEEDVVTEADVDDSMILHYHFPAKRGGLIQYAEEIGVKAVLERIQKFAREDEVVWQPSQSLRDAASSGISLNSYFAKPAK